MRSPLFHVTCTTCQARLRVMDASAVGAILRCPKCESMVQIIPPPGWTPPPTEGDSTSGPSAETVTSSQQAIESVDSGEPASRGPERPASSSKQGASNTTAAGWGTAVAAGGQDTSFATPSDEPAAPPVARTPKQQPHQAQGAAEGVAEQAPQGESDPATAARDPASWVSPTEAALRRWLLLAFGSIGLVVLAAAVWLAWPNTPTSNVGEQTAQPSEPTEENAAAEDEQSHPQEETAEPAADSDSASNEQLGFLRWVPDEARMVALADTAVWPWLTRLFEPPARMPDGFDPSKDLRKALRIGPGAVVRLGYAATDLTEPSQSCVIVLTLSQGHSTEGLASTGEPAGFTIEGNEARTVADGPWRHPFVLVDDKTIVTGPEPLLKSLPREKSPPRDLPYLARVFDAAPPDAPLLFAIDLAEARQTGWRSPEWWLDAVPELSDTWRMGWEVPKWFAVFSDSQADEPCRMVWFCEDDAEAKEAYQAWRELLDVGASEVARQRELVDARLKLGTLAAELAAAYTKFLDRAEAALGQTKCEEAEAAVWMHLPHEAFVPEFQAVLQAQLPVMAEHWRAAGFPVVLEQQRTLGDTLTAYRKAEGAFPMAAQGSPLLPPQTRLSWITAALPYMGYLEWSNDLNPGYSWNSRQNRDVARRRLPEVVNPLLGPTATEYPFPDTHFVGVAGVGDGAGDLPADSPRAGVFSYRRRTRLEDIADGASNTIAILGASNELGPWAAGGGPTARPLTRAPYVNGPDGFGSGLPNGMFAGMADGSVRFVRSDVDPQVVEQLATIHGRETTTASALPSAESVEPLGIPDLLREGGQSAPDPEQSADTPEPEDMGEPEVVLPPIDVEARLKLPLIELRAEDIPLAEMVAALSRWAEVPVSLDTDALAISGLSPAEPVDLHVADADIATALAALAQSLGLDVLQDEYGVWVSLSGMNDQLERRRYGEDKLPQGDEGANAADVAHLLLRVVDPPSWADSGGRGTIDLAPDGLTITQTAINHARIEQFLAQWRAVRERAQRQRLTWGAAPEINPRWQAQQFLQEPVSLVQYEPQPLSDVLANLNERLDPVVFVDWRALRPLGVRPSSEIRLNVRDQPLSKVLATICDQLQCGYRAIDDRSFQITSTERAEALVCGWYPVAELLSSGWTVGKLRETILQEHDPNSWGEHSGKALITYDEPSQTLLIHQRPAVHQEIAQWMQQQLSVANDESNGG